MNLDHWHFRDHRPPERKRERGLLSVSCVKKKIMQLEREVYGRIRSEEMECKNDAIILKFQK